MKIFISQPMLGRTPKEVKEERDRICTQIFEQHKANMTIADHVHGDDEFEIIDSYVTEEPPNHLEGDTIAIWYMAKSIEKLADADMAIFFPGWNKARGCRIEEQIANAYGITCSYL